MPVWGSQNGSVAQIERVVPGTACQPVATLGEGGRASGVVDVSRQVLDNDATGKQCRVASLDEWGEDTILMAFDVDLEAVDMLDARFTQDRGQGTDGDRPCNVILERYDRDVVLSDAERAAALVIADCAGEDGDIAERGSGGVPSDPSCHQWIGIDGDDLAVFSDPLCQR